MAECCSKEYVECCTESVEFGQPLRCDGMNLETRMHVMQCIQEIINNGNQSAFNLTGQSLTYSFFSGLFQKQKRNFFPAFFFLVVNTGTLVRNLGSIKSYEFGEAVTAIWQSLPMRFRAGSTFGALSALSPSL